MPAGPERGLRAVPSTGPDVLDDADLMVEVAKGDQQAFAELYDRYADRLYGVIRKVVRDPAQSEEVAQEVFVEAWRQARRYDSNKGAVATWLMTMAHRRAIDRVRSSQASRDREERVSDREIDRPFDETAEHVETNLEHEQVRAALDELTDLQREAIELAYYGGNTYRETAELLDAPLGTVKTRLRDGLIRLRDTLGVST